MIPTPSPKRGDFVDGIDHPYLPFTPGSTWTYAATGGDVRGTVRVRVTDEAREVAGVMTTVVRSEVRGPDGGLVEETYDWFAQDRAGNVWHFGEGATTYDDGEPSAEASWEAGVDGARAGLVMPAEPRVGDGYRQEYLEGVAEDQREVLDIDGTVELPLEAHDDVLVIADTSPLDPELEEHAYYAPRIGLIAEETVRGGDERVVLTAYTPG